MNDATAPRLALVPRAWRLLAVLVLVGCSGSTGTTVAADPPRDAGRDLRSVDDAPVDAGSDGGAGAAGNTTTGGLDATADAPDALATARDEPESGNVVEPPPSNEAQPAGGTATEPVSELDLLVTDLMAFVERERGHEFESRPPLRLLDTDAFTTAFSAVVARDAERYREDFTNFTDIYQAMGIIETDQTLEEIWSAFGDAGVLGYYDSETGDIVLRGGAITPLTETILVHELTHALDDQIFDIDRPEYDDRDDEVSWSLSAIAEGNAQIIEDRYRETLTADERAAEIDAQQSLPRGVSLSSFTPSFRELQFSRYRHGYAFVSELWEEGVGAVDAAFVDPPATSEMIVDPSQYVPGSPGDGPPPAPPAGGTVFESGVWGEIGWAAIFADVDPDRAAAAADGWGGDWYVAWRAGDRTCVRANITADDADHLDDYAALIEEWVTVGDRDVFYPTADLIRVTSCA